MVRSWTCTSCPGLQLSNDKVTASCTITECQRQANILNFFPTSNWFWHIPYFFKLKSHCLFLSKINYSLELALLPPWKIGFINICLYFVGSFTSWWIQIKLLHRSCPSWTNINYLERSHLCHSTDSSARSNSTPAHLLVTLKYILKEMIKLIIMINN